MQRFILSSCTFKGGQLRIDDADLLHQFIKVLRMRPGDQLEVLNNEGAVFLVEIEVLHKKEVVLRLLEEQVCTVPTQKIVLCFGYLKGSRNEYILEKATEMGVTDFLPVVFERCQPFPMSPNKVRRFEAIIKEATEQSEGCVMPALHAPVTLQQAIEMSQEGQRILAWERHDAQGMEALDREKDLFLFVGPEGGITEAEGEMIQQAGALTCSLGSRILRAETACVALLAKIL